MLPNLYCCSCCYSIKKKTKDGATPEFYDDDIPLLYLGSETPAAYLDDDDDDADDAGAQRRRYYGLFFAAGMQSDGGQTLKRSARHAMNLLKWMVTEWRDDGGGGGVNDNDETNRGGSSHSVLARAFLALPVDCYRHLNLNAHVTGDDRGGAKEDACALIVFLLCYHCTVEGEPAPVLLEELVTSPVAQQAYDLWSARHAHWTAQQQDLVKKNTLARQAAIAQQQRQEAVLLKAGGAVAAHHNNDDLEYLDDSERQGGGDGSDRPGGDDPHHPEPGDLPHPEGRHHHHHPDDIGAADAEEVGGDDDDSEIDELDVMAAMRKRQKSIRQELARAGTGGRGVLHAVRWSDSQLARELAVRERALLQQQQRDEEQQQQQMLTVLRDSADAAHEVQLREDEKAKVLGKDPLGLWSNNRPHHNSDGGAANNNNGSTLDPEQPFDLRVFEAAQAEQMELALHEAQDNILKAESVAGAGPGHGEELLQKAVWAKESLEQLIEKLGGLEAMEQYSSNSNTNPSGRAAASILPTRSTFHPLLFLTLLHRRTGYKELLASMERLSSTLLCAPTFSLRVFCCCCGALYIYIFYVCGLFAHTRCSPLLPLTSIPLFCINSFFDDGRQDG